MGIKEIEEKILAEAQAEADKITAEGQKLIDQLNQAHQQKLAELKTTQENDNQQKIEAIKRSYLVPARLTAKQSLLKEKQNIMTLIYTEVGTEKKLQQAELNKLREDTEVKTANIVFG